MPFFRRIEEEFEARLTPPPEDSSPSPSASGKTERKRYGDGEERLKVRARDLELADGTPVSIVIGGTAQAEVTVKDGRMKLDVTSAERTIPRVGTGDRIDVLADGVVHLTGEYEPD